MSRYVPCSIDPQCWTGGQGGQGVMVGTRRWYGVRMAHYREKYVTECPECSVCPLQGEKCSVRSEAGLTSYCRRGHFLSTTDGLTSHNITCSTVHTLHSRSDEVICCCCLRRGSACCGGTTVLPRGTGSTAAQLRQSLHKVRRKYCNVGLKILKVHFTRLMRNCESKILLSLSWEKKQVIC